MNQGQEIDPMLMQNAHILGQQRTPTKAEIRKMEKEAITMAVLQIAGTALNSILEGGEPLRDNENTLISIQVAKDLLEVSGQQQEDFGENVPKRKLRNQLAAQLVYAALKGGSPYKKNIIHRAFTAATTLIEEAENHAEAEVSKETNDTPSIVT